MKISLQRRLLGSIFLLIGLHHLIQPRAYTAIMPKYLPAHKELVIASGLAEIALGATTFIPGLERVSRWGLIALLLAVFPANINMALHAKRYRAIPPAVLWGRLPLQFLLIAWVWRVTE